MLKEMNTETKKKFMVLALEESKKALPLCLPNPPVGCVLVQNETVIASGFTQAPGQYHAEAMALAHFGGDCKNVAAFVTLEPCSFHGRTPSCAQALAKRNIGAVYVSIIDPHPQNRGKGMHILEAAGIITEIGILQDEVHRFLKPYLITE